MTTLVIEIDCQDPTDLDWLRTRLVGAVEDVVETQREEGRLDGAVEVSWDMKE